MEFAALSAKKESGLNDAFIVDFSNNRDRASAILVVDAECKGQLQALAKKFGPPEGITVNSVETSELVVPISVDLKVRRRGRLFHEYLIANTPFVFDDLGHE